MIKQVLSEVVVTNADDIRLAKVNDQGELEGVDAIDVEGSQSKTAIFKKLAKLSDPKTNLSDADFQYLRDNPENINTDIERKLIALVKGLARRQDATSKQLKQQAIDTLQAKKDAIAATAARQTTVSSPRIGSPQAATRGIYSRDQLAVLNRVMRSTNKNISDRINKISEISKKYFEAAQTGANIRTRSPSVVLSEIMLLDLLSFIAKDVDAGAGAYLFEYFLAYLAGGEVKGKDPNSDSGQMGATDFTDGAGNLGSAKYYKTGDKITQAITGFDVPSTTTYIVALKKQGEEQRGKKSRGASDPDRIIGLDIYVFDVVSSADGSFKVSGKDVPTTSNRKKLVFDSILKDVVPIPLYIAEVYTQTFREMIGKSIQQTNENIQDAFSQMQKFYDSMSQAEEDSRVYIAEGDVSIGIKVLDELEASERYFKALSDIISAPGEVRQPAPTNESKLHELDELILEVLKNNS
jgi:hypothetical protein